MVLPWLGFTAGLLLVLATFASVIGTLVVPRPTRPRVGRIVGISCGRVLRLIASVRGGYEWRDRIMAWQGPLTLLFMLLAWVSFLLLGYGLLLWPSSNSFGEAMVVSGSSLFTLGSATSAYGAPIAITFAAAASGLIVVALEIAYLPVLYGAFNRRESLVTLLDSSGQPSWGPEILARSELNDSRDSMAGMYSRWEAWAADVVESHSTYPILIFFRSPHPLRSWITGLLSVLDAANLQLSITPLTAPATARPLIRMGRSMLESVASSIGARTAALVGPGVTEKEFSEAVEMLRDVGWELEVSLDKAWEDFSRMRSRYASVAYFLADITYAPKALWSGERTVLENSQPAIPPARDLMLAAELRELTRNRRELRHRQEHEHMAHHEDRHQH